MAIIEILGCILFACIASGLLKAWDNNSGHGEPMPVVIKNNRINTDLIQEYTGEGIRNFEYRPTTFETFIGQTEAKNRLYTVIKRFNRGIKSHFFLRGIQGHGKTTLVRLVANVMNAELIERIGKQVNEDTIVEIINLINASTKKNVILFIDEIDSMKPKDIKLLNPIIESFEIAGKKIKPFIFACATINDEELQVNNPDTLDRIPVNIQLTRYTDADIAEIIKQCKGQLFSQDTVPEEVMKIISQNCKFNPRTANSLLSDYVVEQDINKVLKDCQIIKNGLTLNDMKILKVLAERGKPVGEEALAQKVGIKKTQYKTIYEPFLCEYGYIERTSRGRKIGQEGIKILKEVKWL